MRRTFLSRQFFREPLALLLSVVLVSLPSGLAQSAARPAAAPAQALHSKYSESDYGALEKLITTTPPEQMDLDFLKKIYRFNNAKDMLKLIFSRRTCVRRATILRMSARTISGRSWPNMRTNITRPLNSPIRASLTGSPATTM